ncbi:hypothetical protein [Desulfurococcus mucosus]|uniref:LOG family protein n=1 Tax=Desulfurococcus mucosus (strain ATCC 35584 / DSM 2162 / JCM 9187 / O7/1) TaxID=765177 RepID=E8R8V8_DESM0|nr:hypothetical protein [Desulfurococcus mucosus]ADV64934.1 hypothetical protein Desmu_0626 [Desulfurococcus mucosus DSM 2162]
MRTIAVAAYSGQPDPRQTDSARMFIEEICRCSNGDLAVAVGGYWGLMRIIVDAALTCGLKVLIYPYAEMEGLHYPEKAVVVKTGLTPEARSIPLVRSSDALVALGGGVGTMIEVMLAYSMGKPVYLLRNGFPSDRLEVLAPYIDERKLAELKIYGDPVALARDVCRLLHTSEFKDAVVIHG